MFFLSDEEIEELESCVDKTEDEGYDVSLGRQAIRKIKAAAKRAQHIGDTLCADTGLDVHVCNCSVCVAMFPAKRNR